MAQGFYAHNGGVARQTGFPSASYAKINFNTVRFDTNGGYDAVNSRWTPVLVGGNPTVVHISGRLFINGGAASLNNPVNPTAIAKIRKNGAIDRFTGDGDCVYCLPGCLSIGFAGTDLAQPGDFYELIAFITASQDVQPFPAIVPGTIDFDNNEFHHFWGGSF